MAFVFGLCERLGIDDPIAWMDAVPPHVVDQWIAYRSVINDQKKSESEPMSPDEAFHALSKKNG